MHGHFVNERSHLTDERTSDNVCSVTTNPLAARTYVLSSYKKSPLQAATQRADTDCAFAGAGLRRSGAPRSAVGPVVGDTHITSRCRVGITNDNDTDGLLRGRVQAAWTPDAVVKGVAAPQEVIGRGVVKW